ncbi:MAG: LamG domain-containing protein, partial [Planctomycetota bacterium]
MCRKPVLCAALLLVFCVQVRAQNDPNLVGYWNFDDGTVTDLSGNGNNGAFMGQATVADLAEIVFGGSGQSLDVNYQNSNTDWVEIPHSESLNVTGELTVLAWIRPDDIENNDGVITKGTARASWALRFNITNGLRFTANAGFNLNDPNSPNYAPGAVGSGDRQSIFEVPEVNVPAGIDWTLIGVVSDTESLRFVLNLEEEELPARYIFAESDEPLVIGAYLPGDDYFNGLIDEIRIYNRALTRREVITISGLAEKPFEPVPENGAIGVISGDLTWGSIDGTDQLYIGAGPDALELVDGDAAGSYAIADTVAGRTYYWRVDVLTADGTITGDLWSFTMTADAASGPTPSNNADFVDVDGLSFGWLPVVGATAFDVYFGPAPDGLELLGRVTENSYHNPDTRLVSETVHYWRVDTIKNGDVTTGQIWNFKTMPVFAVEEALAAWYKFELGEGATAVDWTRKGNEGVLVGDTKWVEEGFSGGALEFDGAADYVEIPRVVQDDWTIMLWLYTDNLEQSWPGRLGTVGRVRNGVGLVDGDAGGPAPNFAFSLNGDQIVANCMADGQGDGSAMASNTRVAAGDWVHTAWTRNATTGEMSLYINGALDNSGQNDKWKGTKD